MQVSCQEGIFFEGLLVFKLVLFQQQGTVIVHDGVQVTNMTVVFSAQGLLNIQYFKIRAGCTLFYLLFNDGQPALFLNLSQFILKSGGVSLAGKQACQIFKLLLK